MTTSPVMGITEEILGEIERAGWKLVPVEPTPEMIERSQYWHRCREPQVPPENFRGFYDALLAAAPAAPVAQEPAEDAGLAFSALPCAGFWRWLHRCNRVPPAAEHPTGDSASTVAQQPDTVAVPRELLDRAARSCANGWIDYPAAQELRALLAGGAE